MKKIKTAAALLFFLGSVPMFAVSFLCNGTCIECKTFYPLIKETALELKNEYLAAEDTLSSRYNSDIIPLLEDRKILLLEYDRLQAELEALNDLTAIKIKKLNKEKETAR